MKLPANFRKLSLSKRKELLKLNEANETDYQADLMIESCIGTLPIPLGIATGFIIDGKVVNIPMATEEASVIAAATYAACLGHYTTWSSESIMSAQIFLPGAKQINTILQEENKIQAMVDEKIIPSIAIRGGGFRGIEIDRECITIHIDVCDAMGANIVNTVVENLKEFISSATGGEVLMAIVSNLSKKRTAGAKVKIAAKTFRKKGFTGDEVCKRIVAATEIANCYPERAVTHNKGIMNGISALALATGNDTRAVEAAAHFTSRSLTNYTFENGYLEGSIELPLALGTVGGAISSWEPAKHSLKILGNPNAKTLCRYAAALGLGQNLAALFALVTEGIQSGHMRLHKRRSA